MNRLNHIGANFSFGARLLRGSRQELGFGPIGAPRREPPYPSREILLGIRLLREQDKIKTAAQDGPSAARMRALGPSVTRKSGGERWPEWWLNTDFDSDLKAIKRRDFHFMRGLNRNAISFDQALVLGAPREPGSACSYRIFNADGDEVEQCGNGARCIAALLHQRGLSPRRPHHARQPVGTDARADLR
jgi:hypothetical protein